MAAKVPWCSGSLKPLDSSSRQLRNLRLIRKSASHDPDLLGSWLWRVDDGHVPLIASASVSAGQWLSEWRHFVPMIGLVMESVVAATNEPLHLEGGRIDMKSL